MQDKEGWVEVEEGIGRPMVKGGVGGGNKIKEIRKNK